MRAACPNTYLRKRAEFAASCQGEPRDPQLCLAVYARRAALGIEVDTVVVAPFRSRITPVLTVRGAAQAVAFYERAFGAEEIYRSTYPDGRIVSEMAIDGARFRVGEEALESSNTSPLTLNGTTVRINLFVPDPDQLAERAIANGAVEIAPVADQAYGLRQGRLADPFGHHWLIGRPLEDENGDWARGPER